MDSFCKISLLLFIIVSYFTVTESVKPRRMAMKLIHRESVARRNPNARVPVTLEEHMEHLTYTSSARFKYLQNSIEKELGSSDFQIDVHQAIQSSMFYVNFSVGQPPVQQFTIMDTGSSLLWIQCLPCKYCSSDHMIHPVFNPALSSTFAQCSCNDRFCRYAPHGSCGSSNECLYDQVYISGAGSKGVLAKEQLIFTTPNGNTVVTQPVAFGCGHENGEQLESEITGILGLGAKPTSLALQLGSKFSYCIGDLTNKNYGYNQLVLGDADILGDPTPIDTDNGVYYMTLEGISVGEKQLNIEPVVFRKRGPRTGVILDSGTLYTWLADIAYRELYNEIKSILEPRLERFWFRDLLCYHGRVSEELIGFPVVTFHFAGGAELAMEAASMFYPMSESDTYHNVFCMSVRPTTEHGGEYKDFTAIGLMAQQYYNIGYDLIEKNVYLQRIDCVLLDDYSPSK
ncbi:PREDICTED: probable aspartic protease At2g35615 [Camelina sativa]|uniref:Probable aspartic protease At2g35615 n=1 Tax=Camelina sativa TaxID=90675 RepID=A0ABM0TPJ2_CAMSA|nr:PREDICTED: probable aspartic protease At2g35615 [Camelina sativa]